MGCASRASWIVVAASMSTVEALKDQWRPLQMELCLGISAPTNKESSGILLLLSYKPTTTSRRDEGAVWRVPEPEGSHVPVLLGTQLAKLNIKISIGFLLVFLFFHSMVFQLSLIIRNSFLIYQNNMFAISNNYRSKTTKWYLTDPSRIIQYKNILRESNKFPGNCRVILSKFKRALDAHQKHFVRIWPRIVEKILAPSGEQCPGTTRN